MYSKHTLDLYEQLLERVTPSHQLFCKTAAKVDKLENLVSKITEMAGKGHSIKPELAGFEKGIRDNYRNIIMGLGGLGGAGTLGAYGLGKWQGDAKNDWEKMKYGLGGVGLGLAAPVLYNMLTKGGGMNALAARLGAMDEGYQPAYADFTSI